MIKRYKNSLGLSLLELLISLTISIPILASLIISFSNQNKNYYSLHKNLLYFETLASLTKIGEHIMQDLDSHPLPIYPRLQESPYIYLYDNVTKLNKVAHKDSTAITSMHLNLRNLLRIEDPIIKQGKLFFKACLVNSKSSLNLQEQKHAYIVHHEFQSEVLTTFTKDFINKNCYQLEVISANGMFSNAVDYKKLILANYIIPIEWIRTYYLAEDNTLRLLQHRADKIILNQPILNNSLNFTIKQKESVQNHIELTFEIKKQFMKSFTIQHHVPRLDFENFIANI